MPRLRVPAIVAAAVSVTCGGRNPRPPRGPAISVPPAAFCARSAIVDRVALRCIGPHMTGFDLDPDDSPNRLSVSRRDERGWHEIRHDASKAYTPESFTPFESEMMDRQLAKGLQLTCGGTWDADLGWESLHRPELGWPLFGCVRYSLVLFVGDQHYELAWPGVDAFRWIASNLQGHWLGLVDVPSCGPDHVDEDGLCVDRSGRAIPWVR